MLKALSNKSPLFEVFHLWNVKSKIPPGRIHDTLNEQKSSLMAEKKFGTILTLKKIAFSTYCYTYLRIYKYRPKTYEVLLHGPFNIFHFFSFLY